MATVTNRDEPGPSPGMTPRPVTLSPERATAAAAKVVDRLIAQGMLDAHERTDAIRDIREVAHLHMDGYELAKALDDRCYWDCTRAMVDVLDTWELAAQEEMDSQEAEWAAANGMQPTIPNGTRVRLGDGRTGVVEKVYPHKAAYYAVRIDGDPKAGPPSNRRYIIPFEKVTPIAETEGGGIMTSAVQTASGEALRATA